MKRRRSGGFALPTVIIASVIMMVVLLSAVSSTAAIRVSIKEQYYNQLARSGADAGLAYAKACLSKSGGVATWSDASPLKPNTDCSGVQLSGFDCSTTPTDARCSMTRNGNVVSTFSVGTPTTSLMGWAVNDDKNAETISVGFLHTCGLSLSGKAYCWGSGANGELGNSTTSQSTLSPSAVTTNDKFKSISSGMYHTCAIRYDGKAFCWGLKTSGQLGDASSTGNSTVPVQVDTTNLPGDKIFKSISAGGSHSCGIATDNKAYCWGLNDHGQLGNGATGTNSNIPVAVSTTGLLSGKTILGISSGDNHTCAVANNASATTSGVYCWGYNGNSELGNGTTGTDSNIPVAVDTTGLLSGKTIIQLSSGANSSCVLASSTSVDSAVYCWGYNYYGQLGNGSVTNSNIPVAVTPSGALAGLTVMSISLGNAHSCALASNGKLYCWGNNMNGQIGDNTITQRNEPVAVVNTAESDAFYGKTVLAVYGGRGETCAIASDGNLYCWGLNSANSGADTGKVGNNTNVNSNVPDAVYTNAMVNKQAVSLKSQGSANLVRTSDSSVWQSYKAVSKFDYSDRVWRQVSTSLKHACAVSNDGKAYCWGDNAFGQLGDNSSIDRSFPTSVYTGTSASPGALYGKTIVSIQTSEKFTCALTSDYNVYCWGDNTNGSLGNGTAVSYSAVPVAVSKSAYANKPIKQLSVGRSHSCAITSLGQVYCWGNNNTGQLGNNSITSSNVPVATTTSGVLSGLSVISITTGAQFSCAIASDNNAYCWGQGNYSQLGDNTTTTTSLVPTTVYTGGAMSGKKALSIYSGYDTTYLIASDGKTYAWGNDAYGMIGNDSNLTSLNYPAAISTTNLGTKTIASITAGFYYGCALTNDSSVYCWGRNNYAQLGESTLLDQSIPVATNISSVTAGNYLSSISATDFGLTTCSLATDTQTYCWGGGITSNGVFDPDFYATKTNTNILTPIIQSGNKVY